VISQVKSDLNFFGGELYKLLMFLNILDSRFKDCVPNLPQEGIVDIERFFLIEGALHIVIKDDSFEIVFNFLLSIQVIEFDD
jgi:hypothetical protein